MNSDATPTASHVRSARPNALGGADPVLIVGAGPTGMMAAVELSRFGIPYRIVDSAEAPATTSRAIGVQARTLELLEQRGLADGLVARGNRGYAVSAYGGGKRVFRLNFEKLDSAYNYLLFVSQAETEKALRDALERAGAHIERGVTLTAFEQNERDPWVSAVLTSSDGTTEALRCSYIVDAEGAHSYARTTLGLDFKGKSRSESYALGDFYVDGDLADSDLHIFSSEHGFMGLFPMGGSRFRSIAAHPIGTPSQDSAPTLDELQQIYDQRSHIPVKFRDLQWSSWFHINSRMVDRLGAGRVFLAGDSAHIHSPAGAQGMNTGIQDAIDLSWKIALAMHGFAKPELLETYSADRIPVIRNVLTKTEGLTDTIGSENPIVRTLFDLVAPFVVGLDAVQHNSTEQMSQLALNYRTSPLSVDGAHAGGLRAGDRVPDLTICLPDREARLFELMNPSTFTLFYSGIDDADDLHRRIEAMLQPRHAFVGGHRIDAAPAGGAGFAKLFGTSPKITLVRPDAYVAVTATERDLAPIAAFFERWFVTEVRADAAGVIQHA